MLAEGRLGWLRDGEIALSFAGEHGFHLAQVRSGDFRRQMDGLLLAWFGRAMTLRLDVAAEGAPVSVAEEERRRLEERAVQLRARAREHPAVRLVQSLLSGEIQGIDVDEPR